MGPLNLAKLSRGATSELHQCFGNKLSGITGTILVPECLCHIDIFGVMSRQNVLKPGEPQIFRILLANPDAVLPRLGFPVELLTARIAAAGMPLQDDGPQDFAKHFGQQISTCHPRTRSGTATPDRRFRRREPLRRWGPERLACSLRLPQSDDPLRVPCGQKRMCSE